MPDGINYDAFSEALNDKADRDLQNTAAEGKTTSVGWGMPDYANGINFSNNTNYTAPKDGFVMASGYSSTSSDSRLYLNGTEIARYQYSSSFYIPAIVFMPINKGDIIKINFTAGTFYMKFYPLKGAQ